MPTVRSMAFEFKFGDMDESGTTSKFMAELSKIVDYFRAEFDITYAEAIGCLHILADDLSKECLAETDEDDCELM